MNTNGNPTPPDRTRSGVAEPGNGSLYTYCVWKVGTQWFAAFPDYRASSPIASHRHTVDYVQEKMQCSLPDAEIMTSIINRCIGVDDKFSWEE